VEPFKNNISPELVGCIADHLENHLDGFDRQGFEVPILRELHALELKQRAQLISDHLHVSLPEAFDARARVLRAMLHPHDGEHNGQQSDEDGISGWGMFPLAMVVGQHGQRAFKGSLMLLKDMTSRFSSEFDVRYYLIEDQERALKIMSAWVDHPNMHVRRLLSEGTRPRLPWGMQLPQLIADPSPMLPLLEALRDDEEEYVRRSVANHLNDIAKDHPDLVAGLAKDWMRGADKNRERLVRHACRTLIKQGHAGALDAFGLGPPEIDLAEFAIGTKHVALGGSVEFDATLKSTSKKVQSLIIDYLLHFKKANGSRVGKVFKWKNIKLAPGASVTLRKSHAIKPITTRRYYEGEQALSLRINGQDYGIEEFDLSVPGKKT